MPVELAGEDAAAELERAFAALQLKRMVGGARKKPKKSRAPTIGRSALAERVRGFQERVNREDFSELKPADLVAAYAWCHFRTYSNVLPQDLTENGAWKKALLSAGRMLTQEFEGDVAAMLNYIRWTWGREAGREQWRCENNGGNGGRVTWYAQFVQRRLLTDYQVKTGRAPK